MILSKREAIYRRDGRTCVYCRRDEEDLTASNHLTLDHLVPLVDGGKGVPENLVTACAFCNRRKGRMPLEKFVGPTRAAEIWAQARKLLDKPLAPARVLKPPPCAPSALTSREGKIHLLLREALALIAERHPMVAHNMRHRARLLGVEFPEHDSPDGD